jgi:3-hydroxyacyl-CoA dehydrogenase
MKVAIVGAGLMGAQIGCEYALGGHDVVLVARNAAAARERAEAGLRLLLEHGLAESAAVEEARDRLSVGAADGLTGCELVVESLPERLALKVEVLRPVAAANPDAILATNTSSLRVGELGELLGAAERTLGTHYLNPPLFMPSVEVVPGERTVQELVDRVVAALRGLGKRPVVVADVPGFAWNRLQHAVLREALWLVEHGVASPETIDAVLTDGLARRWRNVGFFQAVALGGVETWENAAKNLFPVLSTATAPGSLARWVESDPETLAGIAAARDRGLAADLVRDRTAAAAR